jgi:hypothetical protein
MIRKMERAFFEYCRRRMLNGKHNDQQKTHLLVACMPKSGSTYLSTILSNLEGFQQGILVHAAGRREQELDVLQLVHYDDTNYVAQHHVRYSQGTKELMERFDVKPVVLVRNIYDAVVSFRDHFRNESTENPMGYAFPYMKDWPDEKLEELIVDVFLPWYFNFFMSWQECSNLCLLTYEEMVANPQSTIGKINKHFSLGIKDEDINQAVELAGTKFTRKNVGKTGRGEHLNVYCKQRIERMAGYYGDTNFTLIGILR